MIAELGVRLGEYSHRLELLESERAEGSSETTIQRREERQ
jgi:hypothetical protein